METFDIEHYGGAADGEVDNSDALRAVAREVTDNYRADDVN